MNLPRLPCAGKLGNCPKTLHRFHLTCLKCRWRWEHYRGWKDPPYWIDYTPVWAVQYLGIMHNPTGKLKLLQQRWFTVKIDPRGHFTMLRCATVIVVLQLAKHFPKFVGTKGKTLIHIRKYFVTFCEFFASITI